MSGVDQVARLEEERDFLLTSLRELEREHEAGEIVDADYQALRNDYTARAASVMRALRQQQETPGTTGNAVRESRNPAPVPVAVGAPTRSRGRRRLVATAVLAAVVVAAVAVANFASPRGDDQPLTGTAGEMMSPLDQALQLEQNGEAAEALKVYDSLLRDNPNDVAALAYRGWLLQRAGLTDEALVALDKAVTVDPTFPDAHFFRGMALYQGRGDPAAAIPEFRAFLANRPPTEMIPMVESVLTRAMQEAGQLPATTTTAVPG